MGSVAANPGLQTAGIHGAGMRFDDDFARKYEGWFQTPQGRFALGMEKRLIDAVVAAWPRRGQRLLDIGCGTGIFLELFWQAGFDVTGLDASEPMLAAAGRRLGDKAELRLGNAGHLPFDDNEFDFASLITVLEFCPDPEAVVREAVRVARKGLLVAFLNRHSLYYHAHGRPVPGKSGSLRQATWRTWRQVKRLVRREAGKKACMARSVLPGPASTWKGAWWCAFINRSLLPVHFGAFAAARFDLIDQKPLTPIHCWKTEPGRG